MKNNIMMVLLGMAALLLPGCEGNTTREFKVRNDSSAAISVQVHTFFNDNFQEMISPGSLVTVATTDQLGGSESPGLPDEYIDQFIVLNSGGDTIKKSYSSQDSWEISTEHRHKVPSDYYHEFVFPVTDDDF